MSVIVAALVMTDFGPRVGYHARILICKVAGGSDCEATAGNPDAPVLAKCVVRSTPASLRAGSGPAATARS